MKKKYQLYRMLEIGDYWQAGDLTNARGEEMTPIGAYWYGKAIDTMDLLLAVNLRPMDVAAKEKPARKKIPSTRKLDV